MTRMTAHKRKEWYIVAKNKRLTNKEKQARAELKKRMQDKGVLPPDKPKLNRKKFIDEAREEWNGRSSDCFIWEHYLMDAISYMLCQREGMSSRASLEAVGAAKVLKLAIRLREFSEEVREKGEHEYKLVDQYNYIKDILDEKTVTITADGSSVQGRRYPERSNHLWSNGREPLGRRRSRS